MLSQKYSELNQDIFTIHIQPEPILEIEDIAAYNKKELSTIDLRVDYLRPGIGAYFDLHAQVMRLGSRVASTRMEFCGADGKLLSTGAAAYMLA